MPLFGKSQKSPADLVRALKEAVLALERGDKKAEKVKRPLNIIFKPEFLNVSTVARNNNFFLIGARRCIKKFGLGEKYAVWN